MTIIYGFEACSIQAYILQSNKLKDMVGASALVDALSGRILDHVLEKLVLENGSDFRFARRGGGAFTMMFEDHDRAKDFRDYWGLYVQCNAPGVRFAHYLVPWQGSEGTDAAMRAAASRERGRNLTPMPSAGPLARRAPLTGLAAIQQSKDGELIDGNTAAKRAGMRQWGNLEDKLDLTNDVGEHTFPRAFHPDKDGRETVDSIIRDRSEGAYVGVIHADVNNLGRILEVARRSGDQSPEEFCNSRFAFSNSVGQAIRKAACSALALLGKHGQTHASVCKPGARVIPGRFLVLGGDDLTVVVKGSLAMDFVTTFLERFEEESARCCRELKQKHGFRGLPPAMTACAGVAFVRVNHPFHMAYELCESLCKAAKDKAKQNRVTHDNFEMTPSCLAFHRVTAGLFETWDQVVTNELTTRDGLVWTMQPYQLGQYKSPQLPLLGDLQELAGVLENKVVGAPVRELTRLGYQGKGCLAPDLRRWRANLMKGDPEHYSGLCKALEPLTGDSPDWAALPVFDAHSHSPLADALAWLALTRLDKGKTTEEERQVQGGAA